MPVPNWRVSARNPRWRSSFCLRWTIRQEVETHGPERLKGRIAPRSFACPKRRAVIGLLAPDAGFTVIELLVATLLALLVLGTTATLFVTGQVDAGSAIARADAVAIANTGLREMDQDMRQAYQVEYPTSTSYATAGCTAPSSAGIQLCNQLDVLARAGSGTDYEVRYDCAVASTTITGDQSCWRYQCSASASTGSGSSCLATSGGVAKMLIDDVVNGTSASQVFALCYASSATTGSACAPGATRPSSGTVTIKVPAAGTLSKASNGDPATVLLQDGLSMPNLSFGQ
jgi:type II secretory pathway pseudopilin PulG